MPHTSDKDDYRKAREFYEAKQKALGYYTENGVLPKMEEILNTMFYDSPDDVYGYLANYFTQFAKRPVISKITADEGMDCRGQPAIYSSVYCTISNAEQLVGSCLSANSTSLFDGAKPDEVEAEDRESRETVLAAIQLISDRVGDELSAIDPTQQMDIDKSLIAILDELKDADEAMTRAKLDDDPDNDTEKSDSNSATKKAKLASAKKSGKSSGAQASPYEDREVLMPGSGCVSSVSQAVCVSGAAVTKVPLYEHIASLKDQDDDKFRVPLPMVTILHAGKSCVGKLRCVKEFMIVPKPGMPISESTRHINGIFTHVANSLAAKGGAGMRNTNDSGSLCPNFDKPEQGLDLLHEAISQQGLSPGDHFGIVLNCAAHEIYDHDKGKYEVAIGALKSADDLVDYWIDLLNRYSSILAIIDPFRKQDSGQWMKFSSSVCTRCYVIGDIVYDRPGKLKYQSLTSPFTTSGIVMRLENMNTVSDVMTCDNIMQIKDSDSATVISTCRGDTNDTFIVDMACGMRCRFVKIGAPCRGERITKLNRLLAIERELLRHGKLDVHTAHVFPKIELPVVEPEEGEGEEKADGDGEKKTKKGK